MRAHDPSIPRGRLRVEGLTKRFGKKVVLDAVDFTLEPGSITCISGANGAGKSTLVRCLVGLARFAGSATLDGVALPDGPGVRRWIGYVPQDPALLETATVAETLAFFATMRGLPPGELPVDPAFLPPFDARVGTLSGGQRQRIAFAVGLLGTPRLLLLDEPVASLDDAGRAQAWETVRAAADAGVTMLIASPTPRDLAGIADRVLTLDDGRIVGDGTVAGPVRYRMFRRAAVSEEITSEVIAR